MKRFTRIVSFIIVVAIILAFPAYAVEESQRASLFFASYRAYCYKASSTDLRVYFSVVATGAMDELGTSSIKVQRSSDGTNWTTMKTYTKENYSQMIDTDATFHSGYISYTATVGYYYRAYVTFYAKDGSDTGRLYYYTANI